MVDKNRGPEHATDSSMQILTSGQGEIRMNPKIYEKVCKKFGHAWALKDEETFMVKVCLNCGCEQYFFPEEEDE